MIVDILSISAETNISCHPTQFSPETLLQRVQQDFWQHTQEREREEREEIEKRERREREEREEREKREKRERRERRERERDKDR
jgi:hypothetical protein